MDHSSFVFFHRQNVQIDRLSLHINGGMCLTIGCTIASKQYELFFENVSDLSISKFTYPVTILGFEIVDNSSFGWENSVRYAVCDYEEGLINFYCQDVKINS